MGYTDCSKHGGQTTTITTPMIWEAIEKESYIDKNQLRLLLIRVTSQTPYARYVFDKMFLNKLGIDETERFTILTDEDDERGTLLFNSTISPCKKCVEEICEKNGFKWVMSTQGEDI